MKKRLTMMFAPVGRVLRRLVRRRDGNVLILFAMAAIPVIIGAGIAIDAARAYMVKQRLGAALDAAALAVGSQAAGDTSTQLTTDLNNFFFDNYCKQVPSGTSISSCLKTVATETSISASPTTSIQGATVTYTATSTVPTTFMRLVGVNNLTVTVKTQTTKFPGMEIAVVLDNTGSMLCNAEATGASGYSPCGAVTGSGSGACASNTDWTTTGPNGSDPARICTLIPAANQFVKTLENAFASPQSLYMAIVPYVTTVNVASALNCTNGSTTCTNVANNGSNFTDLRGNILPVIPITGNTTSGSTTISSVAVYSGQTSSYVSTTAPIIQGMAIYGHGIPANTTVSSVSGTSITISSAATLTYTANSLAIGPTSASLSTPFIDPTTFTTTGTWGSGSNSVTVASTSGIVVGMVATAANGTIPTGTSTTVSSISGTTVKLSANSTGSGSSASITFSLAGSATSGSTTISNLKGTAASLNSIVVGMAICGTGIPGTCANPTTYVTSLSGSPPTSMTISAATTSTKTGDIVTLTNLGATTTTGSQTISNVSFNNAAGSTIPVVGQVIVGNGIPANTTITAVTGSAAAFAAGTGSLTISHAATTPSNFSSATSTTAPCPPAIGGSQPCFNTAVDAFSPITFDSTYNSASPAGSSTTTNWGGCVIEPTGSSENVSGTGVLNAAGTPDVSQPVSGTSFYPFYYVSDTAANNWAGNGVSAQDTATEPQADIGVYDTLYGPNQGCPVPMIALTDLTTSAGQTAITNTINSMWPRDAGGTQVHVGMIWGWRVLDPNGPFASNGGHPLSYANATATGWKKIVVLMTDGTEEWPVSSDYTGLGNVADGKMDTTSTATAVTNLGTRLQTLCSNMAAQNIVIFTVGLAKDGQNNTVLDNNCPANGGQYFPAGPPNGQNLATVFQNIANAIIHLRLTE